MIILNLIPINLSIIFLVQMLFEVKFVTMKKYDYKYDVNFKEHFY